MQNVVKLVYKLILITLVRVHRYLDF
jgi:hypothetical protein